MSAPAILSIIPIVPDIIVWVPAAYFFGKWVGKSNKKVGK